MNAQLPNNWPETWQVLPDRIRTGRYTDPDFARLEYDRLWSRVWQFAVRLDEIPEPGDYSTYDIVDQSVVVVRVDEDTIKAYYNSCPHRGTALADGTGTFGNDCIICPFHGWRWDLQGNNEFVLEEHEFCGGKLDRKDVALNEVHCRVYAGFVFINLDPDPQPFDEFIEPVREVLDGLRIKDMRHYWWKMVPVAANWKVAQEAFFETYHVPATHPQLDEKGAEVIYQGEKATEFNHSVVQYDALPRGHGRFYSGGKTPLTGEAPGNVSEDQLDAMIEGMSHLVYEMDAMVLEQDLKLAESMRGQSVPEGSSYAAEFIKEMYARAERDKRPMPDLTPEIAGMWGGEVFIFPNLLILPNLANAMMYRVRPVGLDPDQCLFEVFSTTTRPADEEVPRAEVEHMDDVTDPEQFLLIPRQDFSNIPGIQRGLHTKARREVLISSHHEKMITNMHQELDRYLNE